MTLSLPTLRFSHITFSQRKECLQRKEHGLYVTHLGALYVVTALEDSASYPVRARQVNVTQRGTVLLSTQVKAFGWSEVDVYANDAACCWLDGQTFLEVA